MTARLRIVALISGGGRTVLNLHQAIARDKLPAEILQVIASREDITGIERSSEIGLPVTIPDPQNYDADLEQLINQENPDLICLCGYLKKLRLNPEWNGKVINIHPALLPAHGGQGMYGRHVHQAVLEAGDDISGCTVHFVDELYDHGPILLQRTCPVESGDTPDALADRVFDEECKALPEAIALIASGRVRINGRQVEILPESASGVSCTNRKSDQ
ncbi:MAG: phosphoribosylglycinamide formyltransferase [Phycisphaerales bacterium]|nr:phosphoribosylglycinamide formyltransferase [Phycisphaerales bacterium]